MARADLDALEVIGGIVFVAFGLVQTQVLPSKILGFDLLTSLHTFSGGGDTADITIAMLASLTILGMTLYSNDFDFSGWSALDLFLFVSTVWLILAPPFVPIVESFVSEGSWGAMLAVGIQSLGYGFLSWVN